MGETPAEVAWASRPCGLGKITIKRIMPAWKYQLEGFNQSMWQRTHMGEMPAEVAWASRPCGLGEMTIK